MQHKLTSLNSPNLKTDNNKINSMRVFSPHGRIFSVIKFKTRDLNDLDDPGSSPTGATGFSVLRQDTSEL